MALNIPSKSIGDQLSSTEFNEVVTEVNKNVTDISSSKTDINGIHAAFNGALKNLVDPSKLVTTEYYSPGQNAIVESTGTSEYGRSDYIPVTEGETYSYSGFGLDEYGNGGYFANNTDTTGVQSIDRTVITGGIKFTVPTGLGITHVIMNHQKTDADVPNKIQLETGETVTKYSPFGQWAIKNLENEVVPPELKQEVKQIQTDIDGLEGGFDGSIKNLIDPDQLVKLEYYSPGQNAIVESGSTSDFSRTAHVAVTEGETYAYSGFGSSDFGSGGYFSSNVATAGIQAITMANITGGKKFTVPVGIGITHVVLNHQKSDADVPGKIQLETGDVVTGYVPFGEWGIKTLKKEYLPGSVRELADIQINALKYPGAWRKFTAFSEAWQKKNQDLVFAVWGTSLLARTTNTTLRGDAANRPPLADSLNVFSFLVDKLNWEGQEHRRYDAKKGGGSALSFFTESGAFSSSYNLAEWDDRQYREGHTRTSTAASANVSFSVPINAWQFNLIYRTDSVGDSCTLSISEGNLKMEVYNGSGWVEANGFVFSMLEPAATATKGNTTFQKRLKMRCKSGAIDSRAAVKNVTVTKSADTAKRLNYWGVEWSERQYMITFINAARGSHNYSSSTVSLIKFQDNELYGFNPDFILVELPIINEGASVFSNISTRPRQEYVDTMEHHVFNAANANSVTSKTAGFTTAEIVIISDTPTSLSGGWNETTGKLKFDTEAVTGEKINILDNFRMVNQWMQRRDANLYTVNIFEAFNNEAIKRFGGLYDGLSASGKDGATFSNDGTHWNDLGAKAVAKYLLPLFDFD